jgi:ribA/ribD-fused uncharacterized protein
MRKTMANPIQRNQVISSSVSMPGPMTASRQPPAFSTDVLRMARSSQGSFSLGSIWDAIINFFKSLFRCFSKDPLAHQNEILRLATQNHFIWFYKKQENQQTAFLGNFHDCPIHLWGLNFKCSEAAFQAAKFSPRADVMQRFQNLDGEAAFNLGRALSLNWSHAEKARWQGSNLQVMREVVAAKFNQNPHLKALLLATGNAYLVEHIPVQGRDAFWGDDFNGTGENWLGRIAMEVRGNLGGTGVVSRNPQYDQFLRQR